MDALSHLSSSEPRSCRRSFDRIGAQSPSPSAHMLSKTQAGLVATFAQALWQLSQIDLSAWVLFIVRRGCEEGYRLVFTIMRELHDIIVYGTMGVKILILAAILLLIKDFNQEPVAEFLRVKEFFQSLKLKETILLYSLKPVRSLGDTSLEDQSEVLALEDDCDDEESDSSDGGSELTRGVERNVVGNSDAGAANVGIASAIHSGSVRETIRGSGVGPELAEPGIYSLSGLKAITIAVPPISKVTETQINKKTFSLDILNDRRSSKFSLLRITKRYLNRHLFQKEFFFLSFNIIFANILKIYVNTL